MVTKKISKKEKTAKVFVYLGGNRLMTLGTVWNNKPWAATVFFAFDTTLQIFFYSREDTRHCQYITQNPNVSVVINQNWKEKGGFIKGLQMTGRAARVSSKEYKRVYALYKSRFGWADDFSADHRLYSIKPKEVWYIDQKFFGHFSRVKVL